MRSKWTPLFLIVVALGVYAVMTLHYYPLLPARLATHFGPDGSANGWMPRDAFILFMGFLLAFVILMTSGMASFLDRMPTETMNLPNKAYWLADGRRASTFAFLRGYMNNTGAGVGVLMLAVTYMTYEANLTTDPRLGSGIWVLLGIFLAFTAANTGALYARFARTAGR